MERNSDEQITMHNGRCVMGALVQNGAITHNDLLASFAQRSEEPIDQIKHELQHVLNNGISGGFILKKGNKYAIPGFDSLYEADADKGCESEKKATPKTFTVEGGDGVQINISISTTKGKRKAEDEAEACSSTCTARSIKKNRMYEDDDDGEDFCGFES